MGEWITIPAPVFAGGVSLLAAFIVWILRFRFGFFRRTVTWDNPTAYTDSFTVKPSGTNRSSPVCWTYVRIQIPFGTEPIKNLKIHFNDKVDYVKCYPKVSSTQIDQSGKEYFFCIPAIEAGKYIFCAAKEDFGAVSVEGISADNAKCKMAYGKKFAFDMWWEPLMWGLVAGILVTWGLFTLELVTTAVQ